MSPVIHSPWASWLLALLLSGASSTAATYFVDARSGNDKAAGQSPAQAWKSLEKARQAELQAGDSLLLAAGQRHQGMLAFEGLSGTAEAPITLSCFTPPGGEGGGRALIDGRGVPAALSLLNCRHVTVSDLVVSADGGGAPDGGMRCGVRVTADGGGDYPGVTLQRLQVSSVSYHNVGYTRSASDVRTANGNERYGWGVRFIVPAGNSSVLSNIVVRDCRIERVDHTGLKFTAPAGGIRDVRVEEQACTSTTIARTSWSSTASVLTTQEASARSSATTAIAPTATT